MENAVVELFPRRRFLAIDERSVGIRVTSRLDQGFLNLSLWRGSHCAETFHLDPGSAAKLVGFLVEAVVSDPGPPRAPTSCASAGHEHLPNRAVHSARQRLRRESARFLRTLANRLD